MICCSRSAGIGASWTGPNGPCSACRSNWNPCGSSSTARKTKMVDTLKGEAFGFLGFELRCVRKRKKDGNTTKTTPKKKPRKSVKPKIRDIIRNGGPTPAAVIVARGADQTRGI